MVQSRQFQDNLFCLFCSYTHAGPENVPKNINLITSMGHFGSIGWQQLHSGKILLIPLSAAMRPALGLIHWKAQAGSRPYIEKIGIFGVQCLPGIFSFSHKPDFWLNFLHVKSIKLRQNVRLKLKTIRSSLHQFFLNSNFEWLL